MKTARSIINYISSAHSAKVYTIWGMIKSLVNIVLTTIKHAGNVGHSQSGSAHSGDHAMETKANKHH